MFIGEDASGAKATITLDNGGSITMSAANGNTVLYAGQTTIPDGSGRVQQVFELARDDGTVALALGDFGTAPGHPHQQDLAWLDRAGNTVIADDTLGGVGLAVPYLPLTPPVNTDTATWPATTATTWTSIASCYVQRQNPGITWALNTQADTGTTGQFRVTIDGTTVATSPTVSGAFALWSASYFWPTGWAFNSTAVLSIDAQVTAGTGTVRAATYQLQGVQTP